MPYLKLTNGVPETYSIGQLRRDNPGISFPKNPSDELLAERNVYPYTVADRPSCDPLVQQLNQGPFVQDAQGAWTLTWTVAYLPQDMAEQNVRDKRNVLLQKSDWTQVADAPVDHAAWAVYRQSLRDVSSQVGFPYNVVWPTEPE